MELSDENDILRDHPTIFRKLAPRLSNGEHFECAAGWKTIISDLANDLKRIALDMGIEPPSIILVKEKLGLLRVYLERPRPEFFGAAIDAASHRSLATCELCGASGALDEAVRVIQVRCIRCAGLSREQISSTNVPQRVR